MTEVQIAEPARRAIEAYNAMITRSRYDSPELVAAWRAAHQAWLDAAQGPPAPAQAPAVITSKPRGW